MSGNPTVTCQASGAKGTFSFISVIPLLTHAGPLGGIERGQLLGVLPRCEGQSGEHAAPSVGGKVERAHDGDGGEVVPGAVASGHPDGRTAILARRVADHN